MATIEKQPDGPIAMMIDCETLGLGSDVFVTQVGICIANVQTREYLYPPTNFYPTIGQETRRIDFNTVRWWMGQDPKVIKSVFEVPEGHKRCTPIELFNAISAAVIAHPGVTIWASPAMFDLPLLSHLWQGKPWRYNMERDMMTLYKLLDPYGELQPPPNDMGHDAAADAHWQMEYLFNLKARLRDMQDIQAGLAAAKERNQVLAINPNHPAQPA